MVTLWTKQGKKIEFPHGVDAKEAEASGHYFTKNPMTAVKAEPEPVDRKLEEKVEELKDPEKPKKDKVSK